uniref:Uncharacterized protein n=1 Tax=Arundo donax TaxID=35708 RepID=A0A0A8Y7V8_ARUDO
MWPPSDRPHGKLFPQTLHPCLAAASSMETTTLLEFSIGGSRNRPGGGHRDAIGGRIRGGVEHWGSGS